MARPLLPDELRERIEPLLPPPKPRRSRFPGRKPLDNRKALTGILFVLKTNLPWEDLPREMGCGSGMTCWRRLHDWHQAGPEQLGHPPWETDSSPPVTPAGPSGGVAGGTARPGDARLSEIPPPTERTHPPLFARTRRPGQP